MTRDFFFFLRNLWKERELERGEGRGASLGRLEGGRRVNGEEDSSIAVVDKIVKGV